MQDCFGYATNLVSKFPKTKSELILKLRQKWYGEDVLQRTVKKMEDHGFVNDHKFAQMYIDSELIKKWKSLYKIKGKLLQKGVAEEIIDKLVDKNRDEVEDGIDKGIQKRIGKYKKKWLDWVKIIQKISSKGYKFSRIQDSIDKHDTEG